MTAEARQRIAYPDNPLQAIAWRDCLMWAINSPEIRAKFTGVTGISFPTPATTPLDAMIDEATGHYREVVDRFVDWFNEWIWGENPWAGQPEPEGP